MATVSRSSCTADPLARKLYEASLRVAPGNPLGESGSAALRRAYFLLNFAALLLASGGGSWRSTLGLVVWFDRRVMRRRVAARQAVLNTSRFRTCVPYVALYAMFNFSSSLVLPTS